MVAKLYSDVLRESPTKSFKYGDVQLRDWFRDKALQVTQQQTNVEQLVKRAEAKTKTVNKPTIGKMLMYKYDPKHKDTLPYYDTFPIIFVLEQYSDGWLGLNMHYLPPMYRARLMDALYEVLNNQKYDSRSKLVVNYKILKAASKFRYFEPCIKRYLHSHVRSQLVEVNVKEWDYVMFLPLARFKGATQRSIWNESVANISR